MTTTLGQLIANLFTRYERIYRDEHLAAVATHHQIADVLRRNTRRVRG